VTVLGGKPGIYSARWGGPARDFDLAMKRVNEELENMPDRSAYSFVHWRLPGPMGMSRQPRAALTVPSLAAARRSGDTAMIRFSCRRDTTIHSPKCRRKKKTRSATAARPCAN